MFIAQQIGRYHLLDRIAIGGMAEIYRAVTFDSRGQQHMVAIKRVLSTLSDDDDFLEMLVDEAKIATMLHHPNIAKVYEFSRVDEDYFIAMEYVDGKDVRTIMERLRKTDAHIDAEHCAFVMMRILEALQEVHDKKDGAGQPLKIVHRDVSPSNVLVGFDGSVKLCDFGIAKTTLNRIRTRAGVIKGKVKYMSPEQAMGLELDPRSDLFSAGSVLYEMLTRTPPFKAKNEMDLIFKVRDAKYVKPTRLRPDLPAPLLRILRRALARSRDARYQSASEFAEDLLQYLLGLRHPYRPARLGRDVRRWFARDIAHDQRMLEQFVLGEVDPNNVGQNLLAEVLGEGAEYTQFTPLHPRRQFSTLSRPTRLRPHLPTFEERLPQGADLHQMETQIIDLAERESRVRLRKKRPVPGAPARKGPPSATQEATAVRPLDDDAPTNPETMTPDGQILNPEFHAEATKIIRFDDVEKE